MHVEPLLPGLGRVAEEYPRLLEEQQQAGQEQQRGDGHGDGGGCEMAANEQQDDDPEGREGSEVVEVHACREEDPQADRPATPGPIRQRGDGQQDDRAEEGQPGVHPGFLRLVGEEGRGRGQQPGKPGPAKAEPGGGKPGDRDAGDRRQQAQEPGLDRSGVGPGPEEQEVARRVDLVGGQQGHDLVERVADQEQAHGLVATYRVEVDAGQEDGRSEERQEGDRAAARRRCRQYLSCGSFGGPPNWLDLDVRHS